MNYKNIALRELKDLSEKLPDYTLGQLLYSVLRTGGKADMTVKDLLNFTDEQIYTMVEKAREIEVE